MLNSELKPSSIPSIKRLAKEIKSALGIPHHEALNLASRAGGFESFPHAKNTIARSNSKLRPLLPYRIIVSAPWRNPQTREYGIEKIGVNLSQSLSQLVKPHHMIGRLGGNIWLPDEVRDEHRGYSIENARWGILRTARCLQFMDATGLKPSNSRKEWPKRSAENRIPGSDHSVIWYYPPEKVFVTTDEPYHGPEEQRVAERQAWCEKFGYVRILSDWLGMHNPGKIGGTRLYLISKAAHEPLLKSIASKLEAYPPALLPGDWENTADSQL